MTRLQTELRRLYLSHDLPSQNQNSAGADTGLMDADGRVRAMVLEVSQPAGWDGVAALWQADTGHWSAFVAPGLAGMFAAEPWLDLCPSPDAQANILSRVESMKSADFARAHGQLTPACAAPLRTMAPAPAPTTSPLSNATDPKLFLLAVMNDPTAELSLRIEAAKSLLPYST